jgi:hypothetical protein
VMSGVRVRSVRCRERVGCCEGRFDMVSSWCCVCFNLPLFVLFLWSLSFMRADIRFIDAILLVL